MGTNSRPGLYDKGRNLSSQNVSQGLSSNGNSSVNRQQMQNYLISQVLFDGKEDVRTSRMHMAHKPCAILEDDFAETCEENKKKEEEKKERKKQIKEELRKIKAMEEEQRIKQQENQFESYKKEMEKYLDFVCEDTDHKKVKGKTVKKK